MINRNLTHSFLFEEGLWQASGHYINEFGIATEIDGQLIVTHKPGVWFLQGIMRLSGQDRQDYRHYEYKQLYEIEPFSHHKDSTRWESATPGTSKMRGQMVLLGDSIFSLFQNLNGQAHGGESFSKINENCYANKGALFEGKTKSSSWLLELNR